MAVVQPILDLVELCSQYGLRHVVTSPGSRSAALTIAFARHPSFQTYVIPDERVAAYVGLGMAQGLRQPVILVCTSGTAALNFAPAVAEAFFAEVPLLVLTADRPAEWIHQQDGQTVFQTALYGKHVKYANQFPADGSHKDTKWHQNRIINQCLIALITKPLGAVHLNIPIREPFYPDVAESFDFNSHVRVIQQMTVQKTLQTEAWAQLLDEFEETERVLVAGGQGPRKAELIDVLKELQEEFFIPVVGDIISNLAPSPAVIDSADVILGQSDVDVLNALRPDLLITFGNSFISKNLKLFFRKYPPRHHWHIRIGDEIIDTFQSVTRIIPLEPTVFFRQLLEDLDLRQFRAGDDEDRDEEYLNSWQAQHQKVRRLVEQFLPARSEFNEFSCVRFVLKHLPDSCQLHLANSMAVRYANYVGVSGQHTEVFSNRGTSGIDGCMSTAVGAALATDKPVFLLIGDVAFFYDRNALWHPHLPPNLRIILLNNHGGGIFRMIDGPADLPERERYFETVHHTNARRTVEDVGAAYFVSKSMEELAEEWARFAASSDRIHLLEIETDGSVNQTVFEEFKALMRRG